MDPSSDAPSTTFRHYVAVMRRQKWVVAVVVMVIPAIAVVLSLRQDPLYQATAEVLISRQSPAAVLIGAQETPPQVERTAETDADLARVPAVVTRTLEAAGATGMTEDELLDASDVSPKGNSDLLEFTVADENPNLATRLATDYAREYTRYRRDQDTAALLEAQGAIERRLADLLGTNKGRPASGKTGLPAFDQPSRAALVANLIVKAEQLRAGAALVASKFVVVKPATQAAKLRPRPLRSGLLGLVLGLGLGIGLAFLRDALDTRPRSGPEIARALGLPLLARVPDLRRPLRKGNGLVTLADPCGAEAEAFRILRANLDLRSHDRADRGVVMLTSALEGEGKSTTAANLAICLAQSGRRVILVDLDLRRPGLGRLFNLNGRAGLTDVALARVRPEAALAPIQLGAEYGSNGLAGQDGARQKGALHVLTTGSIPVEAGNFASSQAVSETFATLRQLADLVVVDAPPLLGMGDAIALSGRVDGLILVSSLNVIRRDLINELRMTLGACPAAKLGFVATGADTRVVYDEPGRSGNGHVDLEWQAHT